MGQQVPDRQRGMAQRLQHLVPQGRQVNQAHALVLVLPVRRATAVHPDLVPRGDESGSDFLDGRFETAVTSRNTPRADHRNAHSTPPRVNCLLNIAEASDN
ncbi:hypothetical protein Misp02_36290 [Microtetraspora sp. NBRC 16547]|nr:hypothetical protein Misp02_36290 [Microtetraspora sp. NBRC 16547]